MSAVSGLLTGLPLGLVLAPMQESDIDAVTALEAEVAEFPWTRNHVADCLKAGYSGWVVRDDIRIVGYAILMMVVDEGHLLNIAVAEVHQGRGVGRFLLTHIALRTREAKGISLLLEVRPSNARALQLYEQEGFREIGRRKGYYPAAVGREDALVLRLHLEGPT